MSYLWSRKYGTMEDVIDEVGPSSRTVAHWWIKFRRVYSKHFRRRPIRLGGHGVRVYVDELFMSVRKNMRGRRVRRRKLWIVGGVEDGSSLSTRRRRALDLLRFITRYIRPGTTIITDKWRA